jgi:hypothetical protein
MSDTDTDMVDLYRTEFNRFVMLGAIIASFGFAGSALHLESIVPVAVPVGLWALSLTMFGQAYRINNDIQSEVSGPNISETPDEDPRDTTDQDDDGPTMQPGARVSPDELDQVADKIDGNVAFVGDELDVDEDNE